MISVKIKEELKLVKVGPVADSGIGGTNHNQGGNVKFIFFYYLICKDSESATVFFWSHYRYEITQMLTILDSLTGMVLMGLSRL